MEIPKTGGEHVLPQQALFAFSILYLVCLCALLWVARKRKKLYAFAKGVQSGLFVLASVLAFFMGGQINLMLFSVLLLALVLCAGGDVLLGVANRTHKVRSKPFFGGAIMFSIAHVVFCVLFFLRAPIKWFDFILPLALIILLRLLEKWGAVRLKRMRPMGYIYTALVGIMAGKAVSFAAFSGVASYVDVVTAAGAVLFLLSDVILLFLYFGKLRNNSLRASNLITYYAGVYLLALSAYWY